MQHSTAIVLALVGATRRSSCFGLPGQSQGGEARSELRLYESAVAIASATAARPPHGHHELPTPYVDLDAQLCQGANASHAAATLAGERDEALVATLGILALKHSEAAAEQAAVDVALELALDVPEVARDETRSLIVAGSGGKADEQFVFGERYCNEPGCDCRRVWFQVLSTNDPSRILATISYGWEPGSLARDGVARLCQARGRTMRWLALTLVATACQSTARSNELPRPTASTAAPASPDSMPAAAQSRPAPTSSSPTQAGALSVAELRAAKPTAGSRHRLRGFVVKRYSCPPCPPGAVCKPCMGANVVLSDNPTLHDSYDLDERDVIVFLDDPRRFALGSRVTVEVRVLDRQNSNRGIPDLEWVAGP